MKKNWKTWLCSVLVVGATLAIGLLAGCTADDFKDKIDQTLCDHNYGAMPTETVKEATCSEEGEELWTCLECGKEKTVVLEKLAHNFTAQGGFVRQTKAPTCHEEGEKQSRCGICKTIVTESIEKSPHSVKEMDGQAPTCTVAGYTEYSYCSACNDFITPKVTIPALGHAVKVIKGQEATCTSSGLTDGKFCNRVECGEVLTEQKEIPALGHKIEYLEPIEATCEETGLTAGYACSRCDTVYVEQTETPLKDHVDENGDLFCDDCFVFLAEEVSYTRMGIGRYRIYGLVSGTYDFIVRTSDGDCLLMNTLNVDDEAKTCSIGYDRRVGSTSDKFVEVQYFNGYIEIEFFEANIYDSDGLAYTDIMDSCIFEIDASLIVDFDSVHFYKI